MLMTMLTKTANPMTLSVCQKGAGFFKGTVMQCWNSVQFIDSGMAALTSSLLGEGLFLCVRRGSILITMNLHVASQTRFKVYDKLLQLAFSRRLVCLAYLCACALQGQSDLVFAFPSRASRKPCLASQVFCESSPH